MPRPARRTKPLAPAAGLFLVALVAMGAAGPARGQVSDGDDQFQAYHGDIGRISGSPERAPVAPQTTIVRSAPAPPPAAGALPAAVAQVFDRARSSSSSSAQSGRRPNRITLAVRRDPLVGAAAPVAHAAPAQLQAPPQSAFAEPAFSEPASAAAAASFFAETAAPAQLVPQQQQQLSQPQQQQSVSARHAALVAQVAAERQAASAASHQSHLSPHQHQHQHQQQAPAHGQPSLGSPIEALSAPAAAVAPLSGAATASSGFVDRPEEPLVAPSFEHVLSNGCPQKGLFSYENKDHCDRYYMCTNGTFTEEACPNGLAYSQLGAVYQHCAYNWNVDCGRKKTASPIASPGCPWQFGIFPIAANGQCSVDYFACEWGVPETKRCSPEGLFYDDRIKGCQWADQLGCKSEALLNFKCPAEDEDNPYWPYPRYYHTKQDVIVCVNEQPRLVHCNEEQIVEPSSLACVDLVKKKKKKF